MQGFELSPQQRRLWRTQGGRPALTAQCAWRVDGPHDSERLARALRSVAGRHESLRLKFVQVRDIKLPLQVVGAAGSARRPR